MTSSIMVDDIAHLPHSPYIPHDFYFPDIVMVGACALVFESASGGTWLCDLSSGRVQGHRPNQQGRRITNLTQY